VEATVAGSPAAEAAEAEAASAAAVEAALAAMAVAGDSSTDEEVDQAGGVQAAIETVEGGAVEGGAADAAAAAAGEGEEDSERKRPASNCVSE
jgi:hypothetical protein